MSTAAFSHLEFMHPKLEMKYLSLEKTRNRLLDELEGLDDELLNTPPSEGKWSINQIVYHLLQVEKLTVGYVRHKLQKEECLGSSTLLHSIKALLLKLVLKSGKKIKAPDAAAHVPDSVALHDLRKNWDEARFKLEDVLNEIPANMMDKCLFKHPYVGPLSINQTLSFLQDHFDHHHRQITQIRQTLIK